MVRASSPRFTVVMEPSSDYSRFSTSDMFYLWIQFCCTFVRVLDAHRLMIFRSVVAGGSVQSAAANLGYTPSAVSQHVTALARETGLVLFERVGRGLRPTAAGLLLAEQADALSQIETRYGVEKEIVTAIWGLESAYGTFRGSDPVLSSLATLAYDGRRRAFFEGELLDALRILQAGDTTPARMQGSWAGAMGHTQFMPSSFQQYAEDFTGDGKRDIWSDDPRDALASTAAYLKHFGWVQGQPWGVEVRLPEGFDYLLAGRDILKTAAEWRALGVRPVTGSLGDHGPASLLLPGGAEGAAFLIYANFAVIERYNSADAYVIGVGHLADRIAGGGPIEASWPVQDRALTYDERIELQTQLTAQGFDTVQIDAKIGPLTINAVRDFQLSRGLVPDGYASPRLLEALRAAAAE